MRENTQVAIVGAGPVGLSTAIALARHGIRSTVMERAAERSGHPKARGVRVRTMELFRLWGLEPRLREHALPADALRFIYCDTLAGEEIVRTPELEPRAFDESPTTSCRVAQDAVEETLLAHARSLPQITLRYRTRVTAVAQTGGDVEVTTEDGRRLTAAYVVAADGVGSEVRRSLGIELTGRPVVSWWQSVYWHGDLDRWAAHRPCIQFVTGTRRGRQVQIASVDGHHRWVTLTATPPGADRPADLTQERAVELIRGAAGDPSLEVSVKDIATFRVSALNAERYRDGRIFLVGDAAHVLPPTGGMGMNSGIQDAHNLSWKLAYTLNGWADVALLDTYESERRPVAAANLAWSLDNGRRFGELRAAIQQGDADLAAVLLAGQKDHVSALGQDLGFAYRDGAVVPDGTPEPAHDPARYTPTARPGHRAPAVPLADGSSTLDLFDRDFTLLLGADAPAPTGDPVWLRVLRVGADVRAAYGIGSSGAVLVRPDGHVAWRAADHATDPRAVTTRLGLRGWR